MVVGGGGYGGTVRYINIPLFCTRVKKVVDMSRGVGVVVYLIVKWSREDHTRGSGSTV